MSAPIRQPRAGRAARVKQVDVARAIKGALAAAGAMVARVEVEVNGIVIRVVLSEAGVAPSDDLDRELAEFERRRDDREA
jgi:hypothetical protein